MTKKSSINSAHLISMLLILIGIYAYSSYLIFAQSAEKPQKSIFADDSCIAPCWFGLTPGESKIEDAKKMFTQFSEVFDNECSFCEILPTELMSGTSFDFAWKKYTRDDTPVYAPGMTSSTQGFSYLRFNNTGTLNTIYVVANSEITLSQTLIAMGTPDLVYLSFNPNYQDTEVSTFEAVLIYISERVKIKMDNYPGAHCKADSVTKDFKVDFSIYYSIETATQLFSIEYEKLYSDLYPALVRPPNTANRQIRGERWDEFINGEGYTECEDFYNSLPTDYVLPTLPWSSPTLTPVPSVTP